MNRDNEIAMRSTRSGLRLAISSALALTVLAAAPFTAHAGAWCNVKPGNQAVLSPSGHVIGRISGPRTVGIYERTRGAATMAATYRINMPDGGFYRVYRIDDNKYIDVSSCGGMDLSGAPKLN